MQILLFELGLDLVTYMAGKRNGVGKVGLKERQVGKGITFLDNRFLNNMQWWAKLQLLRYKVT